MGIMTTDAAGTRALAFGFLAFCAACATRPPAPPVELTGQTYAVNRAHYDVMSSVFLHVSGPDCHAITSVYREVLVTSPDLERDANGNLLRGHVKERWTAVACGKTTVLHVNLMAASGGTVWDVGYWDPLPKK